VGTILEQYDTSKQFPVFGYGALLAENFIHTYHCFALTGDIFRPYVYGVSGVQAVYRAVIGGRGAFLCGPTNLAPILSKVNDFCRYAKTLKDRQQYTILLVLTDGALDDMQEAIDEIVAASELPLSVVIVGVGEMGPAAVAKMETLDADDKPLYSGRLQRAQTRDAVQFVEFKRFMNEPELLAKEVLAEIPKQMVSYFRQQGIPPLVPQ